MSKEKMVKCPCCELLVPEGDMTKYEDVYMCQGCAESTDFANDPQNDPTGRGFTNNPDF